MTMRLSKVVNGRCFKDIDSIKSMVDDTSSYMKNSYTLSEYLNKHIKQLEKEKFDVLEGFFKQNEDKKSKKFVYEDIAQFRCNTHIYLFTLGNNYRLQCEVFQNK